MKHPFYCASQSSDDETQLYDDIDQAVKEAQERKMAPFVIYRLVPYPVGHRATNGPNDLRERLKQETTDG